MLGTVPGAAPAAEIRRPAWSLRAPAAAILREFGPTCLLKGSVWGFRPTPPRLRAPSAHFRGCPFVYRYSCVRTEG